MLNASAAFKTDSGKVFKEDVDIVPTIIDKSLSYIPWGSDNNMPYHIIDLIESDETLATCQMFNAEVCYGSGLQYNTDSCGGDVKREVEDFLLDNAMPSYFLGVCQDFKHFAFCVSVVILNAEGTRIVRLIRKEACYCRLTPAEKDGSIKQVLYANWRQPVATCAASYAPPVLLVSQNASPSAKTNNCSSIRTLFLKEDNKYNQYNAIQIVAMN